MGAAALRRRRDYVLARGRATRSYPRNHDLAALCEQLLAAGIKVPPINYPGYMPSGEIFMPDPDGYSVIVAHWGKTEQEAWEKRIGAKS
jgi:hypothetical protein